MFRSSTTLALRHITQKPSARLVIPTFTRLFLSNVVDGGEDTIVSRCTQKISSALSPVKISVTSTNDDPNGSHIQVVCVSAQFEGKSPVQRQRLVYKAIWDELNGPLHAVDSIVAKTPKEAGI